MAEANIQLGKAYVQIVPSARGISGSIQSALAPESVKAGKKSGESMAKSLSQSLSSGLVGAGKTLTTFGKAMTSKVTKPALIAGSVLTGLTLWKGLGRLSNLDMAQAKLRGIGITGKKLTSVMDTVSKAVSGNSFTMAEMTNVAATAIASGVKEGKELESYLANIGDAAAFAGGDLAEMAQIFNKVQTAGKLSMMEVNQLGARGIGIVGILAEQTGKSMEDITASISAGEVSAQDFYDAMHKYMGGAAAEIGDTWTVALKNIGSRLGILGEKFLGNWKTQEGAFYILKDLLQDFSNFIPTLYDKASELGKSFATALSDVIGKVKTLKGHWDSLDKSTQSMIKKAIPGFVGTAIAMGPLMKIMGNLMKISGGLIGKIDGITGSLSKVVGKVDIGRLGDIGSKLLNISGAATKLLGVNAIIGIVIAGFGLLGTAFGDQINSMLDLVIKKGPEIVTKLAEGITSKLPEIMLCGQQLIMKFIEALITNLPALLTAGAEIISSLVIGVAQALPTLIPGIVQVVTTIVITLIDNMPLLIEAALALITGLAEGLIAALPILVEALPQIITGIVNALLEGLPLIIQAGIDLLTALIEALPEIIETVASAMPEIIDGILNALIENMPIIVQAGIDLFVALIEALPEIIEKIIPAIPKIVGSIIKALIVSQPLILAAGIKLFVALIKGMPTIIGHMLSAVGQIMQAIIRGFTSSFHDMVNIGKDIVRGVWQGIKSLGDWLWSKVKGFFSGIVSGVKSLFKIHSPSLVFAGIGEMNMLGFEKGLEDNFPVVTKSFSGMMNDLTDMSQAELSPSVDMKYKLSKSQQELKNGSLFTGESEIMGISDLSENIDNLASAIREQDPQIILDSGVLVGAISGQMDEQFGRIAVRKNRGKL